MSAISIDVLNNFAFAMTATSGVMVALVIGRVAVALVAPVAGQAARLAPAVVRVAVVMLALVAGQAG